MTSKEDDTLPLPGFSQEFSTDASIDEDFIPTTQPESSDISKLSKNSELKSAKSPEGMKSPPIHSTTEGVASPQDRMGQSIKEEDRSVDFIPSTEIKSTPNSYATEDISCKKKILVKAEDAFKDQGDALWESDVSKLGESPALENQSFSILNDTPIPISDVKGSVKKEEYITEIIVNDSADTVDLEQSPVNVKKSESQKAEEKLEGSCSLNSDTERCEETQLFDYSSVLLLGQPGSEKSDRFSSFTPDKSYLQETLDDNLQNVGGLNAEDPSSVAIEVSKKGTQEDVPKVNGNISPDKQVHRNSTTVQNISPTVCRKIDFKLSVSCCFTLNTKTNKVLHKRILKVEEIKKPKLAFVPEPVSDNMSDKSKRHSTSSSGSVYSDKTGLPFALPKRVSAISAASDQTDSSDDDLGIIHQQNERKSTRIPWSNEYLLPLKMDDIMQVTIEKQELPKKKHKVVHDDKVNHLKQILENSSSERASTTGDSQPAKTKPSEETLEKEETENLTLSSPEENKQPKEDLESNNGDPNVESLPNRDTEKAPSEEPEKRLNSGDETGQAEGENRSSSVIFCDGLPVLARWTDKRYYSGVLCGSAKNDRWDVKFDDGASKMVRDDFIIPVEWLKVGALVFALTENEYTSGQIVDIKEGKEEAVYVVELDAEKEKVSVKKSDLRMTDVMVGIIKEKYKPASCTPRVKADIDFDNVLSGKRLREQKTPSQPRITHGTGSPGGKKKSSLKDKKDDTAGADEISETPMKRTGRALRGLKSESGHLVEDKVFSTESPSGNEAGETPLRGTSKKPKLKPKPRSLSYEYEEIRSRRKINKSYLRSDGTPIPGTSGVKFKKQKVASKANNSESPESKVKSSSKKTPAPKVSQSTERSKRKRKLEESLEDSAQKTPLKDGSSRPKRKLRN